MKLKELIGVLASNQLIIVSNQLISHIGDERYRGHVSDIPEDLKQYNVWLILPGPGLPGYSRMELQILIKRRCNSEYTINKDRHSHNIIL